MQALAVFSELGQGSRRAAEGQIACFREMLKNYAQAKTDFILAFESACGLLKKMSL